jgi:hypothetical protein
MRIQTYLLLAVLFLVVLISTSAPAKAALTHAGSHIAPAPLPTHTRWIGEPGSYLLIGGGLLVVGALGSKALRA